jgi:hypothetical protein
MIAVRWQPRGDRGRRAGVGDENITDLDSVGQRGGVYSMTVDEFEGRTAKLEAREAPAEPDESDGGPAG